MNTSLDSSSTTRLEFSSSLQSQKLQGEQNIITKQALYEQSIDTPLHLHQDNFRQSSKRYKRDNPIVIPQQNSSKNHRQCQQHTDRSQISMSQNSNLTAPRAKLGKKLTLNIEKIYQQPQSSFNFRGSFTSRSQTHKLTFSKIGSTFFETNIKEQAQLFKEIQQKALNLKKKQKRQRQLLKQLKKQKEIKYEQQVINHSLQIITPEKHKKNHRRTESHNIQSVFQDRVSECQIQNGEKQGQQYGDNTRIIQQFQQKSIQTDQSNQIVESLLAQLNQNRTLIEKLKQSIVQKQQKNNILAESLSQIQLQKKSGLIKIESLERQLQEININYSEKINRIEKQFFHQKDILTSSISNLNLTIHEKQLQLSKNQFQIRQLTEKNVQYEQKIQKLKLQFTTLQRHYCQNQKALRDNLDIEINKQIHRQSQNIERLELIEKQLIRIKQQKTVLQEQKLKENQKFIDIIRDINASLKAKQLQLSEKNRIFEQTLSKIRNQSSQISKNIIEENNKQRLQINKLILANQQKKKQIISLQLSLQKAQEHIKKVQSKFHANSIELTEKNVSYDFLYMQIQEEKAKIRNLQNQLNILKQRRQEQEQDHKSFLHSSNQITSKQASQDGKKLNKILSTSTIKQIKDLNNHIQQPSNNIKKQPIIQQSHQILLPMSHSINNKLEVNKSQDRKDKFLQNQQHSDPQKQIQILQTQKPLKASSILHEQLSDLINQSQVHDQMIDLSSSKDSNSSKMESSLGAFSEYSRLKSTQSAITPQQEQAQYSKKMKNAKIFAKMERLRKNRN